MWDAASSASQRSDCLSGKAGASSVPLGYTSKPALGADASPSSPGVVS